MGYYSDVRIMTDHEGFKTMQEVAKEIAETENLSYDSRFLFAIGTDPKSIYDHYDVRVGFICFGFDYVKWYDIFDEVAFFNRVLDEANEKGAVWQFVRMGEDYDDVEEFESNAFSYGKHRTMYISRSIEY